MNSINEGNILDFINYLYKNNLERSPNQEELDSWAKLNSEEISDYLNQLFEKWGFTDENINQELEGFFQTQESFENKRSQEELVDEGLDNQETEEFINSDEVQEEVPYSYEPEKRKSYKWLWLFILPIIGISAYVIYKFQSFKQLNYLYVTTDNVAIRDFNGNIVGKMDIFPSKNSVSFLRTTGLETYPFEVKNKQYQYRQVLTDSTTFMDFLLNKKESFAYVNENYVIDNKENFIIYRNVFKSINNSKNENNNLTSKYRKTIVGSLKLIPELQEFFLINSCNNNDKNYTSILKVQSKNNTYQVVAQLSNGKYYLFTGQPDNNIFNIPEPFKFKVNGSSELTTFDNEGMLFKKENGAYFIYDCNKNARDHYVNIDNNGMIQFAKYSFDI
ncbi:MAG TPA: hypothetical protein VLZ83_02015 [Edaphocola sp.]|nr:hypothetical protein [Edaphocola sp.]